MGALAHGDGLGGALKYGAMGAAGGYGGAALRGLSTGGKIAAAGGALLSGGPATAPTGAAPDQSGMPTDDQLYGTETSPSAPASTDGGGGVLGAAGGYLKNALGGVNPLVAGLGAAGMVNSASLGAKANKYANNAYNSAAGSYAERAGLRSAGIAGMLHPQTPDLSNLSAIRSRNPYSGPQPTAAPSPSGIPLARST